MHPVLRPLLLALASTSLVAPAAPNLVVNGGFESVDVGARSWVNVSTLAGWTVTSGPGTGFELRNGVEGSACEGHNFIELDTHGNTPIAQSFSTLVSGQSYLLHFAYAPRANVAAQSNGIEVLWNGMQLGGTLAGRTPGWTRHSFQVTATGADVLSFRGVGASDSLDAVSLTSAVPEPSSYALMLGGLLAVGVLKRRSA